MAEYMDYNDYSGEFKSKRSKIISNIGLVLSIVFLAALVLFIIFRSPDNVRTHYGPFESAEHSVNESFDSSKNQFLLFDEEYADDEQILPNDEFISKYPNIYRMMCSTKTEISKNNAVFFEQDGCLTAAIAYVSAQDRVSAGVTETDDSLRGIMGIDFVTIPYYTKDGSLIIEEPVRYTIKYYTGEAYPIKYIEKEYADPERFKLNYYSISVGIDSDEQMNYLDCKAVLYDAINKQESLSNEFSDKFTDQNAIFDVPELISGGERGDFELAYRYNLIYDLNETDEKMSIRINFDDKMYAKLDRLEFKPNTNDYIYTITIN